MPRAFLLILDSLGAGGAEDADTFGDKGSNTIGHLAEACARGAGDLDGLRSGPLTIPNLTRLGIGQAVQGSSGLMPPGCEATPGREAIFGYGVETSTGKDTPSGHWEISGVPVTFEWTYFPDTVPSFPKELTDALIHEAKLQGILGNKHASGVPVIHEFGEEHIRSGKPICYTSADSVFQIAAHETHFGLERLYEVCLIARRLINPYNVGRVIARPFIGESRETFQRTANRRDYAVEPPGETILDRAIEAGRQVFSIGKIGDIFAHRNTGTIFKGANDMVLFDRTLEAAGLAQDGDLVFANYVDFDTLYGHQRIVPGYAAALEAFDKRIPELEHMTKAGDLVLFAADHGNDPTWRGTDHTREHVPIIGYRHGLPGKNVGRRNTMSDIGATVAAHLGLRPLSNGKSFL